MKLTRHGNSIAHGLGCLALLFACNIITSADAQITVDAPTQISVSPTGEAAVGGASYLPVAGPNGNGLAFESGATNLVTNDTNGFSDVFYRDPATKALVRASISTAGTQGDGNSSSPSMTRVLPDGFFAVAFQSRATNFGSIANPSALNNIFVRIPSLGITENVSSALGFTQANGDSYTPAVTVVPDSSGNKKVLVAFASTSTDLVDGDTNDVLDIFLATITVPTSASYTPATFATITRVTNSAVAGVESDGHSSSPKFSADGRYIVFLSRATNLVSPPIENPNQDNQVYRYDTQTGETILISKTAAGAPGDDDSLYPDISYTGRYIAYFTFSTNIVGTATSRPNFPFVVRYDLLNNTSQQVNLAADGTTSGLGQLLALGISANGRLVTFGDASDVLVSGDVNGDGDVFVKDMETGLVARLSSNAQGQAGNSFSSNPTLTAKSLNGLSFAVVFESLSTNLTTSPTPSGFGDLYATGFTIGAPELTATARLETPPDVALAKKRITLSTQKFALTTVSSSQARTPNRKIKYEFEITRTTTSKSGKSKTSRTKLIDKRNSITFIRKPGTFQVRSRARITNAKTGRTISMTPYSPVQNFTLR